MRTIIIVVFLLFLFSGQAEAKVTLPGLIRCTNEIRTESGLSPLKVNPLLRRAANLKIADMVKHHYWGHKNPVTLKFSWPLMDAVGYWYHEAGENLAIGYETSEEVCNAWKKSPTHLANIINPRYLDTGMAIKLVDLGVIKGVLVVQLFGNR